MGSDLTDREWYAFMGNALGLCVSEDGLLIDTDGQRNLTTWVPEKEPESTSTDR
ncbi:hypothetical protein [Streptomyces sp. SP2-10]|uniref:hypothetical protein n=1 Tax=Streptomyces sp. SP2-10 TaxID=2873385 RepID=UPI001CA76DA9|nr:hypothetical protein [Streptomyces sp. SP2-10]MBY8845548.1 hypothetical protein [Streptomyces sp. SP2-10]